jgi:hypothetical protein
VRERRREREPMRVGSGRVAGLLPVRLAEWQTWAIALSLRG